MEPIDIGYLDAQAFGPFGSMTVQVCDLGDGTAHRLAAELMRHRHSIVIGVDRAGNLPHIDPTLFDCLLTVAGDAPCPWVSLAPQLLSGRLRSITKTIDAAPHAASVLAQILRIGEHLSFHEASMLESIAYSMLLGSGAFQSWRKRTPISIPAVSATDRTLIKRDGDMLTIVLANPEARNATDAAMRDSLWEALAAALDDPTEPKVRLMGEGTCFSTGGALHEFGTAVDPALAHSIRMARSCAVLLNQLGPRAEVVLHGACIGAGIEIAAAAARRMARSDTFIQLPELRMGLIPGAGGTASIPRAIGRHRTAYLCFSQKRISATVAAGWGLFELAA